MRNQLLINRDPFSSQGIYSSFYIYRIPQGDRRSQQRQTTGPVALILQHPISDLTQSVYKGVCLDIENYCTFSALFNHISP